MKSKLLPIVCFFLLLSATAIGYAQVPLPKDLKDYTLYIVMENPEAPEFKPYADVFRSTWTFSKYEFIKKTDVDSHTEKSFFFSPAGKEYHTSSFNKVSAVTVGGLDLFSASSSFNLWIPYPKAKTGRATIFYYPISGSLNPEYIEKNSYDHKGVFPNFSPGMLKNKLQQAQAYMNERLAGKKKIETLQEGYVNKAELAKLQTQTLYVPQYVLDAAEKRGLSKITPLSEQEVFEDYPFPYKLISAEELSAKILDAEPVFYLYLALSQGRQYLTIINSKTGEIIYNGDKEAGIYVFKPSNMKDLAKKIK